MENAKPVNVKIEQELEQYARLVQAQTVVKKWEDVEVAEQDEADFLLFAEKIYKRKKDGTWSETPCMLHPLRNHEKRRARKMAREIAAREKLDPTLDPDLFSELDTLCIMWLAIRNTTKPFEPLYGSPEELERKFDRDVIAHMFGVLDQYTKLLDPRLEVLNKEQFITVLAAISEGRSIRPLLAFDGAAQHSFIVTMASLLHSLVNGKLSPELFDLSTPEL